MAITLNTKQKQAACVDVYRVSKVSNISKNLFSDADGRSAALALSIIKL